MVQCCPRCWHHIASVFVAKSERFFDLRRLIIFSWENNVINGIYSKIEFLLIHVHRNQWIWAFVHDFTKSMLQNKISLILAGLSQTLLQTLASNFFVCCQIGSWQTYVNLDTPSKYMYGTNFIMKLPHGQIVKRIDKIASSKHQLWPNLWCQLWNSHPKMFWWVLFHQIFLFINALRFYR